MAAVFLNVIKCNVTKVRCIIPLHGELGRLARYRRRLAGGLIKTNSVTPR
jgi:hypothetical protein